jgi:hypothetical protein
MERLVVVRRPVDPARAVVGDHPIPGLKASGARPKSDHLANRVRNLGDRKFQPRIVIAVVQ